MEQVLGLRPFVPTKDYAMSKRLYGALDFMPTHEDAKLAIPKIESFGFTVFFADFYVHAFAKNYMIQLACARLGRLVAPAATRRSLWMNSRSRRPVRRPCRAGA